MAWVLIDGESVWIGKSLRARLERLEAAPLTVAAFQPPDIQPATARQYLSGLVANGLAVRTGKALDPAALYTLTALGRATLAYLRTQEAR